MKLKLSKPVIKLVILIAIALLIAATIKFTGIDVTQFTPTKIKNYILGYGFLAPIIFIIIYSLRAVILVIPVGIMSITGGLAFGMWWGTLYILIGATIGSCLSFLTARYFGRDFIESFSWLHKGRIKQFDESAEKHGFKAILFIRLIPLFQYDAVNFGSGLSKIKFRDFAAGSFIGMIPGGFINAVLGSSLEDILSLKFFIALGAFISLMFIPLIYKKIKSRRNK